MHTLTVLFQRRRKYNVPVQMCGHPELNQYMRDVLGSVRPLLEKGAVDRVVLAIEDKVCNLASFPGPIPFVCGLGTRLVCNPSCCCLANRPHFSIV